MYKKIGVTVLLVCTLLVCSVSPIFADTIPSDATTIQSNGNIPIDGTSDNISWVARCTSLYPYFSNYALTYDSKPTISGGEEYRYSINQDYIFNITFYNPNDYNIELRNGIRFQINKDGITNPVYSYVNGNETYIEANCTSGWQFHDYTGDIINVRTTGSNDNKLLIYLEPQWNTDDVTVIPAHARFSGNFVLTIQNDFCLKVYTPNTSFAYTFFLNKANNPCTGIINDSPTIVYTTTRESYVDWYNIHDISVELANVLNNQNTIINNQTLAYAQRQTTNQLLQQQLDAYNSNADNITDTQSNITDTNSTISSVHDQEQSFYVEHQSAIEEVGLSNFTLGDPEVAGTTSVINDFSDLWTNIGPVQIIFTFSLTMSLASYLLKHKPFTKTRDYVNRNSG